MIQKVMTKIEVLNELIASRRSIFPAMYKAERVSDEHIELLLQNANWAPTHKNTEPWRFHVMTGDALVRLSEFSENWYLAHTPQEKYSEIKHNKTKANPLKSSHVIALCMQPDPKNSLPEWEEFAAVAMAVQNMWLTCTALGLGCYWSSPPNIEDAYQLIDMKASEKCFGWFYVGIPQDNVPQEGNRGPIGDKVRWYR
jgi:nitroreductase